MYRTALRTGNLHNLMGKRNMKNRMSKEILTGEFDMAFPHLTKMEVVNGADTGKYSIQMRFKPGSQGLQELQSALEEFDEMNGEGWSPFKVGEGEYDDGYVIVKAKTKYQPVCVNAKKEMIDARVIRQGDRCRAIVKFSEFGNNGGKEGMRGNTVLLQRVQRVAERSGGVDFSVVGEEKDSDLPF